MSAMALNDAQIRNVSIGTIVAVVIVGLILCLFIHAVVGRIIVLLVVIGLGVLVWSQRVTIENHVKNCDTNVSFFWVHVQLSDSVQARCQQLPK